MPLTIGTAGWTVPKQHAALFPAAAESAGAKLSHLQRYAQRLGGVEINSSFYRPHRRSTWERWRAATPEPFRFAVKAPKAVTHTARLLNTGAALQAFFEAVGGLGDKLGPVLFQLPPKLAFDEGTAQEFFTTLRELHAGAAVLEPRHASWFTGAVDRLLRSFEIARAAADPPKGSELAAAPGGWPGLAYWRLHGSPQTYYSDYEEPALRALAARLALPADGKRGQKYDQKHDRQTWVIFDNTALGHASANALRLRALTQGPAVQAGHAIP